jgi:hypothetical protein
MTPESYGMSGRAWSDALMIALRLSADPAIGGLFGYDRVTVQKRERVILIGKTSNGQIGNLGKRDLL